MIFYCRTCKEEIKELRTDGNEKNEDIICQSCYEQDALPWLKRAVDRLHERLGRNHLP